MNDLYFLACLMIVGVFLDWAFKSSTIRCVLCFALMATGITACTQLGQQQVLYLHGGQWASLCLLVGQRLLFKRSRYFGEDDE
ncbi:MULTISPECIES: hypothetical protein [unclassified Pseudomonas]|uniref:hypothetical protein n=1 Tax=unclassified Pseudomonas TaxID=196821 RepID=UPI002096A63F|nr:MULTISPECIES: hypothetical protein [unclassified Pseudomonas]MCO7520122.1 hypothetical protein [Pseudomonas sp. 1]MCO7538600.1 hypothetical protein [Pseudomonas sp. VA159-2]